MHAFTNLMLDLEDKYVKTSVKYHTPKEEVEKLSYYNEVTKEMTQLTEDDRSYFVRWGISKQNYGSPVPEQWLMRFNGVLKPCKVEKTDKKESKDNGKKESDRKRDRYEK